MRPQAFRRGLITRKIILGPHRARGQKSAWIQPAAGRSGWIPESYIEGDQDHAECTGHEEARTLNTEDPMTNA